MASAEQLKMTHSVDGKVMGVSEQVQSVRGDVQDVRVDVQDVRGDVREVANNVQAIDDKLDQTNRSLSFRLSKSFPHPQIASQETSLEMTSCDGSRPQIHPQIITLPAKPITTAPLDGFSREVYSMTGNLLARSCGYTENVRYSWLSPCQDFDRPSFL